MSNPVLNSRIEADYESVRWRATFRRLLNFFRGRRDSLLSFEQVREKLRIGGPVYRGLKTVPISKIIGSLNRYQDFDSAFLPTQSHTASRWKRINRAWYQEESLPPVLLYKVGEAYFVVDGNHRVSVAREQGGEFIDAEVRECAVRVPLTPDISPEDLELLGEQVEFLERSGLDQAIPGARVETTILGGYDRLLEHIAVHRYFMGIDEQRDVSDREAVAHWYQALYLPVAKVIEESGILADFPKRTVADLYLWVMDHRHYLLESDEFADVPPEEAAKSFIEKIRDKDVDLPG